MTRAAAIVTAFAAAACSSADGPKQVDHGDHESPGADDETAAATDDAATGGAAEDDAMTAPTAPDPAIEAHIEMLADEHGYAHAEAEDWLVDHADEAHPRLVELATSGRFDLRVAGAIRVLGKIGRPGDVPLLVELLEKQPRSTTGFDAAKALAVHAAPEAERALLDLLEHTEDKVVATALLSLGLRGGDTARAAVEAELDADAKLVRFSAVKALAAMGAGPSAAALRARKKVEPDAETRRAIDEALAKP